MVAELFLCALSVASWAGWIVWKAPEDRTGWTRLQRFALGLTLAILLGACMVLWGYVVVWLGIF